MKSLSARTPAALELATARMPARLAAIRRQVTAVDHWGVNSHLLGDYAALEDALQKDYPAAKRAALDRAVRTRTRSPRSRWSALTSTGTSEQSPPG